MRCTYRRSYIIFVAALVVAAVGLVRGEHLSSGQESTVGNAGGSVSERRVSRRSLESNISLPPASQSEVDHEAQDGEYNQQWQNQGEKKGLPQCYSAPGATPSEGLWRKCEGGIDESIASVERWDNPGINMDWYQSCQTTWNTMDPSEGPMPYWKWEPERCSLRDVTAAKFCSVMEGRKGILFIGDSLTHLSSTTLACVVNAHRVVGTFWKEVWSACEGKLNITFIRDNHLFFGTSKFRTDDRFEECKESRGNRMEHDRCIIRANENELKQADTLIVNSGAHIMGRAQYRSSMMAASKLLTSRMNSLHGNSTVLIVRNTTPGHAGCTERMFAGPVDSELAASLVAAGPKDYMWDTFRDKNAMLEKAFSAEKGWQLMDAYTPTLLRADMHQGGNDCLHYCVPGPIDHWITLLYNIILVATGKDNGE